MVQASHRPRPPLFFWPQILEVIANHENVWANLQGAHIPACGFDIEESERWLPFIEPGIFAPATVRTCKPAAPVCDAREKTVFDTNPFMLHSMCAATPTLLFGSAHRPAAPSTAALCTPSTAFPID